MLNASVAMGDVARWVVHLGRHVFYGLTNRFFVAPFFALGFLLLGATAAASPPMIDVHVHTNPRYYKPLSQILATNGITRFVNLSGGTPDSGLAQSLQAAADIDGRAAVCVNIRWRTLAMPGFVKQQVRSLERAKAMGARCLKISKALGLYVPSPKDPNTLLAVDAPMLDPIWAAAGRLALPIFIHTGDPKAFFEPMGPSNERQAELSRHPDWSFSDPRFPRRKELLAARDRVIARHPQTTFIAVHFANNPEDIDYVDALLSKYPNVQVDIAARLPEIGRHAAARVRAVFNTHQDRILFGTDLGYHGNNIMLGSVGNERPRLIDIFLFYAVHRRWLETHDQQIAHPTPIQGHWRIDSIGLQPQVLRKIYFENAARLFWNENGPNPLDQDALETARGLVEYFQ